MSVKLRTFDNLFVRIPNETMLKSDITNLSTFPIRRLDVLLNIAYGEDLERLRGELLEIAQHNPYCLDEPAPMLIVQGFGDSSVSVQFSVWASRDRFLDMRNSAFEQIQNRVYAGQFRVPYPRRLTEVAALN